MSLLLALAVIGANLFHASLASRENVLEDSPGALLYLSDFSAFTDEWDLYEGQQSAAVVDEQLELRVASARTATWSSALPYFRDFDMRVATTAHAGPIDNAMGVVFRLQELEDGACELPAIILCGVDRLLPLAGATLRQVLDLSQAESHFAFLISSDGYYSLWKSTGGETRILSAWIASPQINQGLGAANTIRVVARDGAYRFFINGAQALLCLPKDASAISTYAGGECIDGAMQSLYRDDSRISGKLGLIAQSTATGGAGVIVRFDNLLVFSPSESDAEEIKL